MSCLLSESRGPHLGTMPLHTDVQYMVLGDINAVVVTSLHYKGDWLTGGGGEVVEWRGVQEHCPRVRYVSN